MPINTTIFRYIDEVRENASSLKSAVEGARGRWNDGNYERIAFSSATYILSEADTYASSVRGDAQMIYNNMQSIESIINNLN